MSASSSNSSPKHSQLEKAYALMDKLCEDYDGPADSAHLLDYLYSKFQNLHAYHHISDLDKAHFEQIFNIKIDRCVKCQHCSKDFIAANSHEALRTLVVKPPQQGSSNLMEALHENFRATDPQQDPSTPTKVRCKHCGRVQPLVHGATRRVVEYCPPMLSIQLDRFGDSAKQFIATPIEYGVDLDLSELMIDVKMNAKYKLHAVTVAVKHSNSHHLDPAECCHFPLPSSTLEMKDDQPEMSEQDQRKRGYHSVSFVRDDNGFWEECHGMARMYVDEAKVMNNAKRVTVLTYTKEHLD